MLKSGFIGLLTVTFLASASTVLPPAVVRARAASPLEQQKAASQAEYDKLSQEMKLSDTKMASLSAEIATIKKDHASITAALIQAAKTERKLTQDIEDIEDKLARLRTQEEGIRKSLEGRRGVLAEVLGGLERMGINPPPAILVKPGDALSSVRSAILLGAVVPELRSQTEVLAGDLKELTRISTSIDNERRDLVAKVSDQTEQKTKLSMLLQEKEKLETQSEAALADERKKAAELAARATSMKELIAGLEAQIDSVRKATEENSAAGGAQGGGARPNAQIPQQNRLAIARFSDMRGRMELPVAGRILRRYGDDDGAGGTMYGDIVTTQSGAIVTAPADGNVLYAGPFRSYGQLLILDAGDGYHVVLAGLGRISVSLGQSVLAGEPVGLMGEARVASTVAIDADSSQPELYVEFRKDGKPVDPAPWWSAHVSGRTGNDS
ncbi:MAG: murein hydrolase activator EnvC family protein [Rhizobiaceae bacterium]